MSSRPQTPVSISSDDKYTPEVVAARAQVSASQDRSLYSRHSGHRTPAAVDAAMLRLYGGFQTCLVTRSKMSIEIAHVMRRATKDVFRLTTWHQSVANEILTSSRSTNTAWEWIIKCCVWTVEGTLFSVSTLATMSSSLRPG